MVKTTTAKFYNSYWRNYYNWAYFAIEKEPLESIHT